MGGHFNVNSKISSTFLENTETKLLGSLFLEELYFNSFNLGMSFVGSNDNSSNMTVRMFLLARSAALTAIGTDQMPVFGFRWVGDATITILGSDKFAYYNPSGGSRTVNPDHIINDFIDNHYSEMDYIDVLRTGLYHFKDLGKYEELDEVLEQYINHWINNEEHDFSSPVELSLPGM